MERIPIDRLVRIRIIIIKEVVRKEQVPVETFGLETMKIEGEIGIGTTMTIAGIMRIAGITKIDGIMTIAGIMTTVEIWAVVEQLPNIRAMITIAIRIQPNHRRITGIKDAPTSHAMTPTGIETTRSANHPELKA